MRVFALVLLCVLAGRSASAEPMALRDRLLDSDPTTFLANDKTRGIVALTSGGGEPVVVVSGAVSNVAVDPALDLLWLVRGASLCVLDLREAAPQPVEIVKAYPRGLDFTIDAQDRKVASFTYSSGMPVNAVLSWDESPSLRFEEGSSDMTSREHKAAARQLRHSNIVGAKWLQRMTTRARHAVAAHIQFPEPDGATPVASNAIFGATCTVGWCGVAAPLGTTGYDVVITRYESGDLQHAGCQLRHHKKLYALPREHGADHDFDNCGPLQLDTKQRSFLAAWSLCTVGKGCVELTAEPLGWLDDGPIVDPPELGL